MDSFSIFILILIGLLGLAGAHRRYLRYKLVKTLVAEGKTDAEIAKIINAYKGD